MTMEACIIRPGVALPKRHSAGAAGLDLAAAVSLYLPRFRRVWVPTGVKVSIPSGYEGTVRPRSSMAMRGIDVFLGTIDSDYRGELSLGLRDERPWWRKWRRVRIVAGERYGQLVVSPVCMLPLLEVSERELSETERGAKGYGSTGRV